MKNLKKTSKKLTWYTTYGAITVQETVLFDNATKQILRPFSESSAVKCLAYSDMLQRKITDFGADHPFNQVPKKMKEHYGINIGISAAQSITQTHAEEIHNAPSNLADESISPATEMIVTEMDGCMVPIVVTGVKQEKSANDEKAEKGQVKIDKRKNKSLEYREAKMCLAHKVGSCTLKYGGTMDGPDAAGKQWKHCVQQVGFNKNSQVHCVGDGAVWIANQMQKSFGSQGTYLIDFYHLCEYLSPAAKVISSGSPDWLKAQKEDMKAGKTALVLERLLPHIEPPEISDEKAPVRSCYRYIKNRPQQFNYPGAIEQGLPIGSGEVESSHRYIVQKRLKIAGAWWKKENAASMISLRLARFNKLWDKYWDKVMGLVA